ncbi:leucyl/phenylalanyl-tRNA--protein transferase [soil metagenome]
MPIFQLSKQMLFPPVDLAEPDGLLAVGGDLTAERLLLAYQTGIFPWYNKGEPILWWSPDPRMVLYPRELKVTKSMRQVLRSGNFNITMDTDFEAVIKACAKTKRDGQRGTWIIPDMVSAYINLHQLGYAHSVEVWEGDQLVGGLYGIALGMVFCGESMFSKVSNASKAGFITLVSWLQHRGFHFIDCQTHTPHLESLGARQIARAQFLVELQNAQADGLTKGKWDYTDNSFQAKA